MHDNKVLPDFLVLKSSCLVGVDSLFASFLVAHSSEEATASRAVRRADVVIFVNVPVLLRSLCLQLGKDLDFLRVIVVHNLVVLLFKMSLLFVRIVHSEAHVALSLVVFHSLQEQEVEVLVICDGLRLNLLNFEGHVVVGGLD